MNLSEIRNVYFIGIGGIGMSALARYFKSIDREVAGYDKTPTHLTEELLAEGIDIHFEDSISLIPSDFVAGNTLVVVTPAIPKLHSEWNYFVERDYQIRKRAEVLGIITRDTFCFAVAGTHGKTTTSAILGHILHECGVNMTAFVGGIVENYNSNLIGRGTDVTVVEADEFDRSFLHLHPDISCVTSMDADHLDIYGNVDSIESSFREFASKVDSEYLFVPSNLPLTGRRVGIEEETDYSAVNVRVENGTYLFDLDTPAGRIAGVKFGLPGRHNLMNAAMAMGMALKSGQDADLVKRAVGSFLGIRRRFSFKIRRDDLVYIDDYAHHPTEIDAVHQAVRELYPGRKVLAIFQPHLFSRTRDFADGFAESLSKFDSVFLLDIYPARELPIEGITSEWLLSKMTNPAAELVTKEQLINRITDQDARVIVTIGAGDIGEMTDEIKHAINETF